MHKCSRLNQSAKALRQSLWKVPFNSEFTDLLRSWTHDNFLAASLSFRRGNKSNLQKRDHACLSEEGPRLFFRRGNKPVLQKKEQAARSRTARVLDCRASGAIFGLLFMKALNYTLSYGVCVADGGLWVPVLGHCLSISWTTLVELLRWSSIYDYILLYQNVNCNTSLINETCPK